MQNTTANTPEAVIAAFASKGRDDFSARYASVKRGTVVRLGWTEVMTLRDGHAERRPVVRWYAWTADGAFQGHAPSKRDAVEVAAS